MKPETRQYLLSKIAELSNIPEAASIVKDLTLLTGHFELVLPYNSQEFITQWELLRGEAKWRRKSKTALQTALKLLSTVDEPSAIEAIKQAISGGYQGIFPKQINHGKQTNNQELANVGERAVRTLSQKANNNSGTGGSLSVLANLPTGT